MDALQHALPFGSAALPARLRLGAREQLPAFERAAYLAARATGCPMALVTLLTPDGQWNIGRFGLDDPSLPLSSSICQRVLPARRLQQVHDTVCDARLATLELIAALKGVRFYAGQPIVFRGEVVGMVCVLDVHARVLDADDETALMHLATIVAEHLEAIDQHAMAQHERQRAEEFARASGDWFWELDEQLAYRWLSPNFRQATGLDPQRLLGRFSGRVRVVPQLLTEEPAPIESLLRQRQDFFGVLVDVVLHGEPRIVKLNGLVLTDEHGRFAGYRGTGRDVTEFVKAVKAAEREAVQRETAERTAEAKSSFLSHASHELRTPLNAIIGFTQLMLLNTTEPLPPRLRSQVEMVGQAGQQLLALVNDILDLSRLEHEGAPELEPLPLVDAVREALDLLQVDARRRSVELHNGVPPGLSAMTSPLGLRRVLMNVVSNAIKYNREGGRVDVIGAGADGAKVVLTVRDTGSGLDPAKLEQLFQPFNRLGAQQTGVPGSGLGLVISRSLMRSMGGELRVASAPDVGTEVHLELPAMPS